MNIANIDKAIAIMKRVPQGRLDMCEWQQSPPHQDTDIIATSEEELHACGNKACFAGYVAISPEWKADGGSFAVRTGAPIITTNYAHLNCSEAIAYWLGISSDLAAKLVGVQLQWEDNYSLFYQKMWEEVEPADVIEKLLSIKEGRL